MICRDVQELLTPYVDGELDLLRSLEVEEHLRDCSVCAPLCDRLRQLRQAVATEALRHPAPVGLRERIRSTLPEVEPVHRRRPSFRLLASAAALVLLTLTGWEAVRPWLISRRQDPLTREIVSSHVRSLMADHLVDVKSSDRHMVKPWFQGKLPFSPPVPDLADQGFPLAGGRLDYLDDQRVAAIVYRRREHRINLFVRPTTQATPSPVEGRQQQGYQLLHWSSGGLTCWAISDLNEEELREFARHFQERAGPVAP
jgi:anti-sigma factor RsiW